MLWCRGVSSFLTFFDATWLPVISKISLIVGLLSYTVWGFLIKDIFTRAKSKIFMYVITAYTVILIPNAYQTFVNAGFLEISFMSIYSISIASIINLYLFGLAITEYIRTIERKRQYLEKMNEIQINYTSIGKIIGNITHQWKVPLVRAGSLLTQTEALIALKKDKALEEIHHEIVPALRENMEFMRETIDTFYALYKGDSTKSTFKPQDVLANIWGMLSAKAAALNVTLNATIAPRMSITSYEHHFGHLLMILLDNAIDTAKERTLTEAHLYVSIARDEANLYISVEDTCGGIVQTPIESIFELDVSSKESSTQKRGSGLYIFKTILDIKFGGTMTVKNRTHGARFDITIPFNAQKKGGG
jgi:signal transduction histidine kinase